MLENRIDFTLLFDVTNGNPNGDPAADGMPRVDPETGHGLVSDVSIKRRIRIYLESKGYPMHLGSDGRRTIRNVEALEETGGDPKDPTDEEKIAARDYIHESYWDVRAFGASLFTTKPTLPSIRGAVNIPIARSIDPIMIDHMSITQDINGSQSFGKKYVIPYALYRLNGMINVELTPFSKEDFDILIEGLIGCWAATSSANSGILTFRKLLVWEGYRQKFMDGGVGDLHDTIQIKKLTDTPREYRDYDIVVTNTVFNQMLYE